MNEPVIPSRLLFEVDKDKRLPWVSHVATDIRQTFLRVRGQQSELSSTLVASIADAKAKKARK